MTAVTLTICLTLLWYLIVFKAASLLAEIKVSFPRAAKLLPITALLALAILVYLTYKEYGELNTVISVSASALIMGAGYKTLKKFAATRITSPSIALLCNCFQKIAIFLFLMTLLP